MKYQKGDKIIFTDKTDRWPKTGIIDYHCGGDTYNIMYPDGVYALARSIWFRLNVIDYMKRYRENK